MTITARHWTDWDHLTETDQVGNRYPSRDFTALVRQVLEDNPTPEDMAGWIAATILDSRTDPDAREHDNTCGCDCYCCEDGRTLPPRPRPRADPHDPATGQALEVVHALEHRYGITLTADPLQDDAGTVDAGTFAATLAVVRQLRHTSAGDLPRQLRALTRTVAQLQDTAADLAILAAIARNPTPREDNHHD